MSMQHRLPDQGVRPDPWTLFCAECSQKMRITMATPAEEGWETLTYECVCGHGERTRVALRGRGAAATAASQVRKRDQRSSMKMNAASPSRPRATTRLSKIRTTKDRANPLRPSVRDAMLAAAPNLRGFAISLSRQRRPRGRSCAGNPPARHSQGQFVPAGNEHVRLAIHHPPQPVPYGIPQAPPRSRRRRRPSRR